MRRQRTQPRVVRVAKRIAWLEHELQARREGRGFLPILDVARLNHVPFVIRSHNRGPSLHAVLRALEDDDGWYTGLGAVECGDIPLRNCP